MSAKCTSRCVLVANGFDGWYFPLGVTQTDVSGYLADIADGAPADCEFDSES